MYHSRWKGSHYEAGFAYGTQFYRRGRSPFDNIIISEERKRFAKQCIPLYEEHFPEILQEIKGMADGLHMDAETVAHFLFSMYCFTFDNKCSCFAFHADGRTILAKNSDLDISLEKLCDSAYYKLEGSLAFVGNTSAWTEIEDGMNEQGFAAALTFILPTVIAPGLNAGMLVRYLLEKAASVEEAIHMLETFPIASAQTLTLADRSGDIAVVECNCKEIVVRRPTRGKKGVYATNHFVSARMREIQGEGIDVCRSRERYETLSRVLEQEHASTEAFAQEVLAGKHGFLCQYDRRLGVDTCWAAVYNVTDNRIFRAEGNPGRKMFVEDVRLRR